MTDSTMEALLDAARRLPVEQQKRPAEQLMAEARRVPSQVNEALAAVQKTRGAMRDLDRKTIIWLAEDEELCGY